MQLVRALLEQFQADFACHRRFGADRRGFLRRPFVPVGSPGIERVDDVLEAVGGKVTVDPLQIATDPCVRDIHFGQFLENRLDAERLGHDPLLGFLEPGGQ